MKQLPDLDGYFDFTRSVAMGLLRGEVYELRPGWTLGRYQTATEGFVGYVALNAQGVPQHRFRCAFTAAWWACCCGFDWECRDRFGRIVPGIVLLEAPR